jgi:hypothetical protein
VRTFIGILAATSVAVITLFGGQAQAGQPEACLAFQPSTPLTPGSCTYKATVKGGVDASGDWVVVIKRPRGRSRRPRVITIDSRRLPPSCETTGPRTICPIGTIKPGDTVTSHARTAPTFVGTGNPGPVPNPGAPPPIAGGPC